MHLPLIPPAKASDEGGPPLMGVAATSGEARRTPSHSHARGQLLGATRGLLTVEAMHCRWVVLATHAVWVPPDVPHGMQSHGPFTG
ncbi:hypothetical protein ACS5PN_03955 [Roseateles sp. NT4]|uniref:hypothetical protein n=1 Tax=Roseateles sp. NT4 TaxID=3453715 RepID=UPI003EEEE5B0